MLCCMQICPEEDYSTVVEMLVFDDNDKNLGRISKNHEYQPTKRIPETRHCITYDAASNVRAIEQRSNDLL